MHERRCATRVQSYQRCHTTSNRHEELPHSLAAALGRARVVGRAFAHVVLVDKATLRVARRRCDLGRRGAVAATRAAARARRRRLLRGARRAGRTGRDRDGKLARHLLAGRARGVLSEASEKDHTSGIEAKDVVALGVLLDLNALRLWPWVGCGGRRANEIDLGHLGGVGPRHGLPRRGGHRGLERRARDRRVGRAVKAAAGLLAAALVKVGDIVRGRAKRA